MFQKDAVIRCVEPLTAGSVSVLAIGDSMTYGGTPWLAEVQDNLSGGAVRFAGTQTTEFRGSEYHHEGFNGITALDFLNSRSQETVVIPADSVHPNKVGEDPETFGYDIVGYLQFADVIFSVLSGTLNH